MLSDYVPNFTSVMLCFIPFSHIHLKNANRYALYRYWDTRQANPVHVQQLPERCYALTVNYPLMIVGTADRHLVVFNLQNPQVIVLLNCYERVDSF